MKTYPIKCRITAADAAGPARVDVYDDIGGGDWFGGGISASDFAGQMAGVKGPLEVHINSGGGDVFDGIAISQAIRAHKGAVTTIVDGVAASIASVIFQAGQQRVMTPGSMMMIHDAFGGIVGNAAEVTKFAETLDKVSGNLAAIYAERAGGTPGAWRDAMRTETWYTADEAVDAGLADRVDGGAAALPPGLDLAAFSKVPGRIAAALRTLPVAAGARHEPMTGTHSHPHPAYGGQGGDAMHEHEHSHDGDADHGHGHGAPPSAQAAGACCPQCGPGCGCMTTAARARAADAAAAHNHPGRSCWDPDGDGDCDLTPEGDTDHDYWAPDGTQLKPVPGTPMPDDALLTVIRAVVRDEVRAGLAAAAGDVDNSPWDASKAWHNGATSDDPAAFYKAICAGRKDGDPKLQSSWALPYKYTPSSPPNAAGVRNALGRLDQAQGLTNKTEAKALLQRLMKQINPDYEPEDHAPIDVSGMDLERLRDGLRGAFA